MLTSANETPDSFITFRLGDERFAIDIHKVREVLELPPLAKVPMAPAPLRGMAMVRSCSIPVIDLRIKFGLPSIPDSPETRVLILELLANDRRSTCVLGAVADAVEEVIELSGSNISPPPAIGLKWTSDIFSGIGRFKERPLFLIDIEKVISSDDLRSAEIHTDASAP